LGRLDVRLQNCLEVASAAAGEVKHQVSLDARKCIHGLSFIPQVGGYDAERGVGDRAPRDPNNVVAARQEQPGHVARDEAATASYQDARQVGSP
jgi:hypothetical protein